MFFQGDLVAVHVFVIELSKFFVCSRMSCLLMRTRMKEMIWIRLSSIHPLHISLSPWNSKKTRTIPIRAQPRTRQSSSLWQLHRHLLHISSNLSSLRLVVIVTGSSRGRSQPFASVAHHPTHFRLRCTRLCPWQSSLSCCSPMRAERICSAHPGSLLRRQMISHLTRSTFCQPGYFSFYHFRRKSNSLTSKMIDLKKWT